MTILYDLVFTIIYKIGKFVINNPINQLCDDLAELKLTMEELHNDNQEING